MLKVYLAHPIDTTGELNDSIRVAQEIESITKYEYLGTACDLKLETETGEEVEIKKSDNHKAFMEVPKFDVYTPAFNDNINNKENLPSSELIYTQEFERMLSSDIVVANYTGEANEVLFSLGYLAGVSDYDYQPPTVYVYSSNKQITQPYSNNPPFNKLSDLVLTAIDMNFIWCDTEENMLQKLKEL